MVGTVVARALLVIAAGVLVAADYDIRNGRHNITMGSRRYPPHYPVDMLLYQDRLKLSGSWFPYPRVQSHDVCYPPKGSHPARSSITAFNVTDMVAGSDGGYAFITQGGVGFSSLCLHLKTQRGKGYEFKIEVFGYYI